MTIHHRHHLDEKSVLSVISSKISRSVSLSVGKPENAHLSSKQKVSQCLGSVQTWDFRVVMSSDPPLMLC